MATFGGKNGAQISWRAKLHNSGSSGKPEYRNKNYQGLTEHAEQLEDQIAPFSAISNHTARAPPLFPAVHCKSQIPSSILNEIVRGQLELKEDIQTNKLIPSTHREVVGARRKLGLILSLSLPLPPSPSPMNQCRNSADFSAIRQPS